MSENVTGLNGVSFLHVPGCNTSLSHCLCIILLQNIVTGERAGMATVICSGKVDAKKRASCIDEQCTEFERRLHSEFSKTTKYETEETLVLANMVSLVNIRM